MCSVNDTFDVCVPEAFGHGRKIFPPFLPRLAHAPNSRISTVFPDQTSLFVPFSPFSDFLSSSLSLPQSQPFLLLPFRVSVACCLSSPRCRFFFLPQPTIKMSARFAASRLVASATPKVARPAARTQFASVTSKRAMSGKENLGTFATEQLRALRASPIGYSIGESDGSSSATSSIEAMALPGDTSD